MEWIITIIGVFVGISGVVCSTYFGIKSSQAHKKLRRITWDELRMASRELRKRIEKKFKPDVIFVPCKRGATIANLMFDVDENILLYVGIRIDKRVEKPKSLPDNWKSEWEVIETIKYYHYIPQSLLKLLDSDKNIKLLIIDDFAMTGDFLERIKNFLIEKGVKSENVKTATLVCSYAAYKSKKPPEFFWFKTEFKTFYFPWGEAV